MNKESGYINFDMTEFVIIISIFAAIIGALLYAGVSFVWPYFINWLHAITG